MVAQGETEMTTYTIRNIPAFTDHNGRAHQPVVFLTMVCSRGFRWDAGEFTTRAAAVAHAEANQWLPINRAA